jgi:hypothetical protein
MYACAGEIELVRVATTGQAPDRAEEGQRLHIHAVPLGPPLD